MTRILKSNYDEILARVNARAVTPARAEKSAGNFLIFIKDLEKATESPKNSALTEKNSDATSENNVISNLTTNEVKESSNSQVFNVTSASSIDVKGVKAPAIPVKVTPALQWNNVDEVTQDLSVSRVVSPQVASKAFADVAKMVPESKVMPNLEEDKVRGIILTAGRQHGLDPHLALAVAKAESSFNIKAVSNDGFASKGLFQLLDSTGRDMLKKLNVSSNYKPFDPKLNSHLGVGYLRYLHDIFSARTDLGSVNTFPAKSAADLENIAVAAFNVGEGAVAEAQSRARSLGQDPGKFASIKRFLPASTRDYVERVSDYKKDFNTKPGRVGLS